MIQEKYKLDYEQYKCLLELGVNVNSNLKNHHESLKVKYGKKLANSLWGRFVNEYSK